MTAGVQTIDSAAYLPPPPPTSTSDAKGTGAADRKTAGAQTADPQGEPSDFHNELQLQQGGTPEAKSEKNGAGKSSKKRDPQTEDANLPIAAPVQVTEPQKPILPLAFALVRPQEDAKPDGNAKSDEKATPDEKQQEPVQSAARVLLPIPIGANSGADATVKQSEKVRQLDAPKEDHPNASQAPEDVSPEVLPFVMNPVSAREIPMRPSTARADVSSLTSAKPAASSESHPVSRAELTLPAIPAEPVPSAVHDATAVQDPTVQEKTDSAPPSPSALAFAARMATAPQNAAAPAVANAANAASAPSVPPVASSQTPAQIPIRYAPTAQILQSVAPGNQPNGPKKELFASIDSTPRTDIRTDLVLPRFESVSAAAPATGSAAPQQAAPPARTETIVEPPAEAPTSSRDIRVRVPDNNGGSTQVRFVESGGEVRVSVRTADASLAQNLRTHLNDLTQRLSDGGMHAETWKPLSTATAPSQAASSQDDQQQPGQQDGRGSNGQGSNGQREQQDRQQRRPAWLEEMEASLQGEHK